MKNIIIYGAGSQYGTGSEILKVSRVINTQNAVVTAFFDESDQIGLQKNIFTDAVMMKNIEEIQDIEYDYIVIASYEYDRITVVLQELGVAESSIIQFFNYHFYLIDEIFYKDIHIKEVNVRRLFLDLAAARMALKY
jgi:hypothetical protein